MYSQRLRSAILKTIESIKLRRFISYLRSFLSLTNVLKSDTPQVQYFNIRNLKLWIYCRHSNNVFCRVSLLLVLSVCQFVILYVKHNWTPSCLFIKNVFEHDNCHIFYKNRFDFITYVSNTPFYLIHMWKTCLGCCVDKEF